VHRHESTVESELLATQAPPGEKSERLPLVWLQENRENYIMGTFISSTHVLCVCFIQNDVNTWAM
jgi:hypothetical protein